MQKHKFQLSINTGFLVNRYTDPSQWTKLVSEYINIRNVQFTADLINPSLPDHLIKKKLIETKEFTNKYSIKIQSAFTGAFTRLNNLAHPDPDFRNYYLNWFKKFADMSAFLGASSVGSHFAILTQFDLDDPDRRKFLENEAIVGWLNIAEHAAKLGLKEIFWEPMSISREFGETIDSALELNAKLNKASAIPFSMCLDVDHGDLESKNPQDTDPYSWIEKCGAEFNMIHLKQSYSDKSGHWPFTPEHNSKGIILPQKIIDSIKETSPRLVQLVLELSFKERQPADRLAAQNVKDSVDYWQKNLEI